MPRAKVSKRRNQDSIGISRQVWEWAKSNPRYESLLEELEDLEDLRREKVKKEKGIPFTDVLKEYEITHHVQLVR